MHLSPFTTPFQHVGSATMLMSFASFSDGASVPLWQLGDMDCNCWESMHIGSGANDPIIFGDNNHGGSSYQGTHTAFWIR